MTLFLVPLTPAMFLKNSTNGGIAGCYIVDRQSLYKMIWHRQNLKEDLPKKFRNKYLGLLRVSLRKVSERKISLGDMVLIGNS